MSGPLARELANAIAQLLYSRHGLQLEDAPLFGMNALTAAVGVLMQDAGLKVIERNANSNAGLLEALEADAKAGGCPALICDDNGHWAVTSDGYQTAAQTEVAGDVGGSYFIKAAAWKDSPREAIQAYLQRHAEDDKPEGGD